MLLCIFIFSQSQIGWTGCLLFCSSVDVILNVEFCCSYSSLQLSVASSTHVFKEANHMVDKLSRYDLTLTSDMKIFNNLSYML
jgi:hypothetical protein